MVAVAKTDIDERDSWYFGAFRERDKPRLSEWADEHRVLSLESNPLGGKWRTSTVEYTREPMNLLTDPLYEEVILQWPTQSAKTEILMNFVGYIHEVDPGPILYMIETKDKAEAIVTDRYLPMLRDTPILRKFRKAGRGRGTASVDDGIESHTRLHHSFPGGHFTLVGANSPVGVSTRPIRYLLMDEWDAYPPSTKKEGAIDLLAEKRTTWFRDNRKIVKITSPRDDATSRVGPAYEASDQRKLYVPCLKCGTYQELDWFFLRWKRDEVLGEVSPSSVGFECQRCNRLIPQRERYQMLLECQWRAQFPGRRVAGFWLWQAYCPPVSWLEIIEDYLKTHNEPEKHKVHVNTVRALTWKPIGESAGHVDVMERAEERPMFELPTQAVIVTAGIDVQHDRLEVSIYAWGVGEEGWLVGHYQVFGKIEDEQTQKDLDNIMISKWADGNGRTLHLAKASMDSGYKTNEVYDYVRKRQGILATKGVAKADAKDVGTATSQDVDYKGQIIKDGIKLWPIGTYKIKEALITRLLKQGHGPKTLHYPAGLSEEFYLQLTAEELQTFYKNGEKRQAWVKKRPRNEAWDCLVLAYHAALVANVRTITQPPSPVAKPAQQTAQQPANPIPRGMIPAGTMNRLLGR